MGCACYKAAGEAYLVNEDVQLLESVALFRRLPKSDHPLLAKRAQQVEYDDGTVLMRQGDAGSEFFVIKRGTLDVTVDGKLVASLQARDYVGEQALIHDAMRCATVVARGSVQLLKITREDLSDLGLFDKLEFPKREAVGLGGGRVVEISGESLVKAPGPKTPEERALMSEAIRTNDNLIKVMHLDDEKINSIVELMWKESVSKGTEIIRQGDLNANYFYIVQEGSFEILVSAKGGLRRVEKPAQAVVGTVGRGGSFGELALLYLAPRGATLLAKANAVVWVIDRVQFKGVLAKSVEQEQRDNVKYLDKVDLLQPLKAVEKQELAKGLIEAVFKRDEIVFKQGERGEALYILVEGEVSVIKDGHEEVKIVAPNSEGGGVVFGERALLSGEPRAASIRVTSAAARCLTIDKVSFEMVIGSLQEIISRGKDGSAVVHRGRSSVKAVPSHAGSGGSIFKRFGNIMRADLTQIGLLGCGGFGAVFLVEHKVTEETYAMKSLSKGYIIKSSMQNSVISEKTVQAMCDSPFIVKLYETYNEKENLLLLLEVANGGEVFQTYNRKRLFGNAACQKFYVAGTTFAFEHLHGMKVLYRDLKPENLLINATGQVKLTDMGLAKVVVGMTFTTCGTPDYFAPELCAGKGHSLPVDWWTLGILAFELMVGRPPFDAATPMQTYTKVARGIHKAPFPSSMDQTLQSFVKELCDAVPSQRLAAKGGGTDNIKRHAWYTGFSWREMEDLTMTPPYVPKVSSKKDLANFSVRPDDMPPQLPYKDPGTGWDKDFATNT